MSVSSSKNSSSYLLCSFWFSYASSVVQSCHEDRDDNCDKCIQFVLAWIFIITVSAIEKHIEVLQQNFIMKFCMSKNHQQSSLHWRKYWLIAFEQLTVHCEHLSKSFIVRPDHNDIFNQLSRHSAKSSEFASESNMTKKSWNWWWRLLCWDTYRRTQFQWRIKYLCTAFVILRKFKEDSIEFALSSYKCWIFRILKSFHAVDRNHDISSRWEWRSSEFKEQRLRVRKEKKHDEEKKEWMKR